MGPQDQAFKGAKDRVGCVGDEEGSLLGVDKMERRKSLYSKPATTLTALVVLGVEAIFAEDSGKGW